MTLEQATRKALDALEPIHHGNMTPMAENAWKTATAALREALEGQPAQAAEPVAYLTRNAEGDPAMLFFDKDEASTYCEDWVDPEPLLTPHQLTQAQAGSVTADDLKQPRNGAQWRVEWWNESCRMLLPANKRLDSFQTYRNGTLMFTIKEKSGIKGGQHGAE